MKKKIVVLGAGAWGTAVAQLLSENGHQVTLWCYEPEVAQAITKDRCNERYLPEKKLHESIEAVSDLKAAFSNAQWVFEAVPVKFLRSVLQACVPFFSDQQTWVALSKGIENETVLLAGQVIDDVFKTKVKKVVVSGPSFAKDLSEKQITAVTVASEDKKSAQELQTMLASSYFRPYVSDDVLGVQLGGALKNVITLAIGMLDGAGYTDNTKAFLLTAGLKEMVTCAQALGGKEKTIYGFSGVGDLMLTSMGELSRNLAVGKRLGSGQSLELVLKETGFIPEGINSVKSVHQLVQKNNLDLPILNGMHAVIFEKKSIKAFLDEVMARPLQEE